MSEPPTAAEPASPPSSDAETARRPPSAAEARALGHPLRLKIVFACRERARTNKDLADLLGTTPGTIHYHLKQLVDQGFLRAEEPRPGPRGSTERPYRSTGKSWLVGEGPDGTGTLRQVAADELRAAGEQDVVLLARLGMNLPSQDLQELGQRLDELLHEFAARSATTPGNAIGPAPADTEPVTLLVSIHRSPDPDRPVAG